MQNKTSKKGFTITELVIVIVVIAILAAVLIPTFASLIKKANVSADTQLAKNLNTSLAMYEASGEKVDEFVDVLNAARDAGYIISNLNPTTEGCYFVWESTTNQILLVDGEDDYKVIYAAEKDYPAIGSTWYFATADAAVAKALKEDAALNGAQVMDMVANVQDFISSLNKGGDQKLYIDESVVLDKNNLLVVDDATANLVLEMGNAALNTSGILTTDGANVVPVAIKKGTVTINGGYISAAGAGVNADDLPITVAVRTEAGTNVTFNGTEFMTTNTAAQIRIGGTATMTDTVINSSRVGVDTFGQGMLTLENVTINVKDTGVASYRGVCIWSCTYDSTTGGHTGESSVTIKSGVYTSDGAGTHAAISSCGGDIVIEGGTFTAPAGKMFTVVAADGEIVISGGTFNGVAFAELDTVAEWQALCMNNENVALNADGSVTITKA